MLRSTRRGLETRQGRERGTLADGRGRQQGTQTSTYTEAPVLDPPCEGGRVRFPSATRLFDNLARKAYIAGEPFGQGYTVPLAEPVQRQHRYVRRAGPGLLKLRAKGDHDEHRQP